MENTIGEVISVRLKPEHLTVGILKEFQNITQPTLPSKHTKYTKVSFKPQNSQIHKIETSVVYLVLFRTRKKKQLKQSTSFFLLGIIYSL